MRPCGVIRGGLGEEARPLNARADRGALLSHTHWADPALNTNGFNSRITQKTPETEFREARKRRQIPMSKCALYILIYLISVL